MNLYIYLVDSLISNATQWAWTPSSTSSYQRKSQEKPDDHHKKDEYDRKHGVLDSFNLFKMSWTTPKFEKLGPMPGGKQGEERQDFNEGQSNDARNADTEGDVEIPPLDFENEEILLSDGDKNSADNSGSGKEVISMERS